MRPDGLADWHRRLGEASCLPAGHPQREDVEREVARRGGLAEQEWRGLLMELDGWRLALRRSEVPEGLHERLLQISAQEPVPGGGQRRLARALAAALVLLLLLLAVLVAWPGQETSETSALPEALRTLALLVQSDHLDTHGLEVQTQDPDALRAGLAARLPFPVHLPALGAGAVLEGGRRCTLGSHPVCFSAWRLQGVRATLIQLRPADFGLPAELAPRRVRADAPAAGREPLDVLVWARDGVAYALVADTPQALDGRPPGAAVR